MKCVKCGGTTKKTDSARVFHDKIVINPVKVEKCQKCGEEYVGEREYERVRRKVENVKAEIDHPALKKIQFLVV